MRETEKRILDEGLASMCKGVSVQEGGGPRS